MFRNLFLMILSLTLLACGGKNAQPEPVVEAGPVEPEYPVTVPFEAGVGVDRQMVLSEIADSVQYIPLETNDKCLIDFINSGQVVKTGKYWFISGGTRLYQYTIDGKFVRTIGSKGGGPGQYNYFHHVNVNEESGLIYMLTTSWKINVYNFETGKFLYDIKIPDRETTQFAMLNDSVVATFLLNSSGQQKERIYISDLKGDTLNTFYRSDLFETRSGTRWLMTSGIDRYMFHYDNKVCYKEFYNDTLFVVTAEKLEPRYIIDLGKYAIPMDCRMEACDGDWKTYATVAAPYIRNQVIETDSLIFMPYNYWAGEKQRERHMVLYDKSAKECFSIPGGYIQNDFPGALPLRPATSLDKNLVVSVWEVEDIMKEAEKNPAVLEHPRLKGLTEDDNPVLMVVYLK